MADREGPAPDSAGGGDPDIADIIGIAARLLLHVAGAGLVGLGLTVTPDTAIQEIYQLNALASGLVLIAATGVWGAVRRGGGGRMRR